MSSAGPQCLSSAATGSVLTLIFHWGFVIHGTDS